MEMTVTVARTFDSTVFEVLNADSEDVLDLMEYMIFTASNTKKNKPVPTVSHKNDGFWDF